MHIEKIVFECLATNDTRAREAADCVQRYYDDFSAAENTLVPKLLRLPRDVSVSELIKGPESKIYQVTIEYREPVALMPHLVNREGSVLANIADLSIRGSINIWPKGVQTLKPLVYSEESEAELNNYLSRAATQIIAHGIYECVFVQATIPGIFRSLQGTNIYEEFDKISRPEKISGGWQTIHEGAVNITDIPKIIATKYMEGSLEYTHQEVIRLYGKVMQDVLDQEALSSLAKYLGLAEKWLEGSTIDHPRKYAPHFRIIAVSNVKKSDHTAITMKGDYCPKISEN